MPFKSMKQMKFMFANHPAIARQMVEDAKRAHKSPMSFMHETADPKPKRKKKS